MLFGPIRASCWVGVAQPLGESDGLEAECESAVSGKEIENRESGVSGLVGHITGPVGREGNEG